MSVKPALSSIKRATAVAAAIAAATAIAQEPSTFQKTCNHLRYGVDSAGTPVAVASCPKSDNKTRVESYVALRGFHNKNGRLSAGAGPATFHKTCTDIKVGVRKDDGAVVISAMCPKSSGERVETSSILWDVHVDSTGQLHHLVPGTDKVVPPVK